jgi:chromosome segregation ATPase
MSSSKTHRRSLLRCLLLGAGLSALLILPSTVAAATVPSLASTAQYKAFIAYVKKLDGIAGQPRSAALKASYEAELSTKKEAAAHKANALFNRAGEAAQAEANASAKEQTVAVRGAEEEELDALQTEFGAKLERANTSYRTKAERVATSLQKFETRLRKQIATLRAKKAKSGNVGQKNEIQERITALGAERTANRTAKAEQRAQLKAAFGTQKEEIHSGEATKETEIGEAAEATVEKIATHWKRVYTGKKASLNAKRESQLAYLVGKLEKGRADVATMPSAG